MTAPDWDKRTPKSLSDRSFLISPSFIKIPFENCAANAASLILTVVMFVAPVVVNLSRLVTDRGKTPDTEDEGAGKIGKVEDDGEDTKVRSYVEGNCGVYS